MMKSCLLPVLVALAAVPQISNGNATVDSRYLSREELPAAAVLRISNNHPFPIREKVRFRLPPELATEEGGLLAVSHSVSGGTVEAHYLPIQVEEAAETDGAVAWIDVQLRAGESRHYSFQNLGGGGREETGPEIATRFPSGLPHRVDFAGGGRAELFDLHLVEIVDELDSFSDEREGRIQEALTSAAVPSFELVEQTHGPVFSRLRYRGTVAGENDYQLDLNYRLFSSGICDVEIELRTVAVKRDRAYLALAKRWPSAEGGEATIRWKGEQLPLEPGAASPPRTNRMHSWGRDVNWLSVTAPEGESSQALLAEFATNLTRPHKDRYFTANDFLVNEWVTGTDGGWAMLAEIARENRMTPYVPNTFIIPQPDEPLHLRYRVLPRADRSPDEVDQAFLAFAGYQRREAEEDALHVSFGVPGVSFGTSYFPHSTFGENFEHWRSAGLQGDRWWPRFGRNFQFFKEDIRRDMRIANAIGLDWIRIHHVDSPNFREDYLSGGKGQWMLDYLEFMADTARETGLGLFLDFSLSPNDARLVAERFGDVIGFYEIQNEVLLMGAFRDRLDYWNSVRDQIRSVRPEAPVFVTGGPQFYSLYDRLAQEGVEVDAVGQHAYVDARQSPGYVRDIATSLGGYATRTGRMPLNSEYNWRMITRESEESQAQHFFEIYENLLSQRSIPLLFQFQFIETLAVAPDTRGALRHYEPLRIDRTPKRQAHAYHEIIRRYAPADHRLRALDVRIPLFSLSPGRTAKVPVTVTNRTGRPLEVQLRPLLPNGLTTESAGRTITLRPRQSETIERIIQAGPDLAPGFYHIFEEIRYEDTVRYGWSYGAHRAHPRLELAPPAFEDVQYAGGRQLLNDLNLSWIRHIVFGREAPALEVDWALYLYNTLRSATGTNIQRWAHDEVPSDQHRRSLLLVGNQNSNPLVAELEESLPVNPLELPEGTGLILSLPHPEDPENFILLISGSDARGVERAASDFLFRYWRHAKDAASFREGMAAPEGPGAATVLPAAGDRDVALEGPDQARRGQTIRIQATHPVEPPSPAAGVRLVAVRDGREEDLGKTDEGGELRIRLDAPGTYRIRATGPSSADHLIEVE